MAELSWCPLHYECNTWVREESNASKYKLFDGKLDLLYCWAGVYEALYCWPGCTIILLLITKGAPYAYEKSLG